MKWYMAFAGTTSHMCTDAPVVTASRSSELQDPVTESYTTTGPHNYSPSIGTPVEPCDLRPW